MLMKKTAILQVADSGPLESLVVMLQSVGYECRIPSEPLKHELRKVGCPLVLDISSLVRGMGYDWPMKLPEAGVKDMERRDVVYVDVKAHQCYGKVVARWPNLEKRVLWYRINGAKPEHVINERGDHGDEIRPPCPILTPNMCYAQTHEECGRCDGTGESGLPDEEGQRRCWECEGEGKKKVPWYNKPRYVMWPPFVRFDEYDPRWRQALHCDDDFTSPICLIHGVNGWGYGALIPNMRQMGVRVYGAGSPDGLIPHSQVKKELGSALCMVHLKSSDAPGYSLLESLAAGCPVVCTRRLIWRCRMSSLLIPGETCLVFDRETHDGLTERDVAECTWDVRCHLYNLRDPDYNRRIGMAGRERLKQVMWSKDKPEDVASLREFMNRHFER
jgi:hypothetical protein